MTRVLIADDQAMVRAGLRSLLEGGGIEVVGEATDGAHAVEAVRRHRPDVVLMDIRMPGVDGLAATRTLREAGDPSRILVLTTFDLDEYLFEALRSGASGFLLKDVSADELIHAVRAVAAGDGLLAPSATRRLIEAFAATGEPSRALRDRLSALTARECEVLELLGRGASNGEIAGTLVVTPATVKSHVGSILAKLGLRDRVQAVIFAYECGLVRPGESSATAGWP